MSLSLHTVSIGTYLQILPALAGLIDKACAHCQAGGGTEEALANAGLAADMWPLAKQVTSAVHHSEGAIRALRSGEFRPDPSPAPADFASLRQTVADAIAFLEAIDPAEIEGLDGGEVALVFGDTRWPFTARDFILSFSLPNFYFHATAAYAILRQQGLPIGKMDFIGQLRLKS